VRRDLRVRAEDLVAGDAEAAVDALGHGARVHHHVGQALLGRQRGPDHAAGDDVAQQPLEPRVARVAPDARPLPDGGDVHVHREGRAAVAHRQALLGEHEVDDRRPAAAELGGDREVQVARRAQVVVVLEREARLAVVQRRPLGERVGQAPGQRDVLALSIGHAGLHLARLLAVTYGGECMLTTQRARRQGDGCG
jgi:hypothetical protein